MKGERKSYQSGNQVLIQRVKSSLKTPWDPDAFTVQEVKGSKLRLKQGEQTREQAKNNVKLVIKKPEGLQMYNKRAFKISLGCPNVLTFQLTDISSSFMKLNFSALRIADWPSWCW